MLKYVGGKLTVWLGLVAMLIVEQRSMKIPKNGGDDLPYLKKNALSEKITPILFTSEQVHSLSELSCSTSTILCERLRRLSPWCWRLIPRGTPRHDAKFRSARFGQPFRTLLQRWNSAEVNKLDNRNGSGWRDGGKDYHVNMQLWVRKWV